MVVAASGGGGGWAETFALGRVSRVEARSKTRGGGEKKACGGDGRDETFLTLSFMKQMHYILLNGCLYWFQVPR